MNDFRSSSSFNISGVEIHSFDSDNDGTQEYLLPSGLPIVTDNPLDVLKHVCSTLRIEPLARTIAAISANRNNGQSSIDSELEAQGIHPKSVLRDYQLMLILKLALDHSENIRTTTATAFNLVHLCRMLVNARESCDNDDAEASAIILRFANQQFWDQENLSMWPRGLLIWREMNALLDPSERYDVNQAFAEFNHGLTFDSFIFLCFALYALVSRRPGSAINTQSFVGSQEFRFGENQVQRFLRIISIPTRESHALAHDPKVYIEEFGIYNLSPLVRWPALRLENGGIIVPFPRLLLDRVTSGAYYDFLQNLKSKDRDRFGQFWGLAFEKYVGRMLEATPGMGDVKPARRLKPEGMVCDWVVQDDFGSVLFECKTRALGHRARTTGLTQDVRSDLLSRLDGSSLPHGLAQLMETQSATGDHLRNPARSMLVTLDDIYYGNDERIPIHAAISDGSAKFSALPVIDYDIGSSRDVESLCRAVEFGGISISKLLRQKASELDSRRMDIHRYVSTTFALPDEPTALHREVLNKRMRDVMAPFLPPPP